VTLSLLLQQGLQKLKSLEGRPWWTLKKNGVDRFDLKETNDPQSEVKHRM